MKPPKKEDIIRIEMIDKPIQYLPGEGIYEWRHMDTKFYIDLLGLEKEIKSLGGIFEKKHEAILDRLYNFRKIYLNLKTGEMST